jgi:hypothetical protein
VTLRSRLQKLAGKARQDPGTPTIVAVLDDGSRLGLVRGEWIDWPADRPLPPVCKVFLFDPRDVF